MDSLTEEERNAILDALAEQRYADFEGNTPVLSQLFKEFLKIY